MLTAVAARQEEVSLPAEGDCLLTRVRKETLADPYFGRLLKHIEAAEEVSTEGMSARQRQDLDRYVVKSGCLYRIEQLYRGGKANAGRVRFMLWVPKSLREEVLYACHDHLMSGGHLGVDKTFAKLRLRYY